MFGLIAIMFEQILSSADVINNALERLKNYHYDFGTEFPAYGAGKSYVLTPNQNWLAGFWSGILWLSYAATGDSAFREHAESLLPTYEARLTERIRLNHDLGFLFTLAARPQYELTGHDHSKALAIRAADELFMRFNSEGRYLQAWNDFGDPDEGGRFIIDGMLNIPLLFWASHITDDLRYAKVAVAHAETSQRFLVRDDGSTYHTYIMNPETGEPICPHTHQGYSDTSMWSRGQAWAITGFAIVAQWTGRDDFLDTAKKSAERFMEELPAQTVPLWDFRVPKEAPQYPDSSAAAIAANGMLRISQLTGMDDPYAEWARSLIHTLITQCYDTDPDARGWLQHGTLHAIKGWGIDTYQIFGDYFFLEALLMIEGRAPDFWVGTQKG